MKELTKEWYIAGERADFKRWIKLDQRAEKFDEEYYQEVYNRELSKEIDSFAFKPDNKPQINPELIDRLKKFNDKGSKKSRAVEELFTYISLLDDEDEPDDKKRITRDFENSHQQQIQIVETLPDEIKERIADKRIFALGYASQEVIDLLTPYCNKLKYKVDEICCRVRVTNSLIERDTTVGNSIWEYNLNSKAKRRRNLNQFFYDEEITEMLWVKKSLWISTFDRSLVIKNANILQEEESIIGTTWLEHETYRKKDGFEIHFLFLKYKNGELYPIYFTVEGSDLEMVDVNAEE